MSPAKNARPYGLLVMDIKILACREGMDWWLKWRRHAEPTGRVLVIPGTSTPQGDHVWIRCDDPYGEEDWDLKEEANNVRRMFMEFGIPASALKVTRRPASLDGGAS